MEKDTAARAIGRYVLFREVAHGGMATVHLGRLRGPAGFARTVAIKRLHPQYARDPEFVSMFLDEARLAARIQHPNVVGVLDVVAAEGELFLVMDYVHGESFARLIKTSQTDGVKVSPRIVMAIASNVLDGLHAAHEARNERGDPLGIVHRDVSPQNVLVGADGVARVLDFGIAKATERLHSVTRDGEMKGKVHYMAPEQLAGGVVDRRSDVYAASVLLWEGLTRKRLFPQAGMAQLVRLVIEREHPPPSHLNPDIPAGIDEVVLKGLARDPAQRWVTAQEMALALERACPQASAREVGEWVRRTAERPLSDRARSIAEIENAQLPARAASEPPGLLATLGAAVAADAAAANTPAPGETPAGIVEALGDAPGVPKNRRSGWMVAATGLVGGLIIGAWMLASHSSSVESPAAAASAVAAPAASPAPEPPPVLPSPVESAASLASVAPPAPSPPAPPPAPPRRRAPVAPRRSGCNPPYTIDANGVRIPKRQCL